MFVALVREDVVVVATVVGPDDLGARLDLDLLRTEGVVDRADPDLDALHQRRRRRALVQGAAVAGVVGAVVAAGTEEGDGRDDAERSDPALHDSRAPGSEIGRAHVCTPVTNAPLLCRLRLAKKNTYELQSQCR